MAVSRWRLLHRYCTYELDQWDLWRLPTDYDEVYIRLAPAPYPDESPDSYRDMAHLLSDHP